MDSQYVPTNSLDVAAIIQSLNDYLGTELALPGSWSPQLFYEELKLYPVKSKRQLGELIVQANKTELTYLQFFQLSRDQPHPQAENRIWTAFEKGSVMLYFEELFLALLSKKEWSPGDELLVKYIDVLSKLPISDWDKILEGIGACSYKFFIQDPYAYATLPFRTGVKKPEDQTDFELIAKLSAPHAEQSRAGLLERVKNNEG